MKLELNPLLDGLDAARRAAGDIVHADDEITVDDRVDHWIFEFIPRDDTMGGGARVSVAKSDFRVLEMVRCQ